VEGTGGVSLDSAAACLAGGGVALFPTETLYALGCLATNARAVADVYRLKRRSLERPLLLLAAHSGQLYDLVALDAAPQELLARFWPGPLTVLLPARGSLPESLVNADGKAAVRVTSHALAAALALRTGGALTASSANRSGGMPARALEDADGELLTALKNLGGCVVRGGGQPIGGAPSTIVEPLPAVSGKALRVLREGAVSVDMLTAAGFVCLC